MYQCPLSRTADFPLSTRDGRNRYVAVSLIAAVRLSCHSRQVLALTALLIAAAPVSAPDVNGRWDLKAGEVTIFRMEIVKTPAGTSATWERPQHFETDGQSFSRISGPVVRRQARSVRPVEGGVVLLFDDP